jgi:hypothetical protein
MRTYYQGDIMKLYAIEIRDEDLPLITHINHGILPYYVQSKPSYFVFDAESEIHGTERVVTEEELISEFEFVSRPHVIGLK